MTDYGRPGPHILRRYDKDMRKLQKRVLKMGAMVEEQMQRLQAALALEDGEAVQEVIEGDRPIDLQEVKVDKFITRLLARRSPVGSDLRFIVAASRIVTDLERLGDEMAQMAKVLLQEGEQLGECDQHPAREEVRQLLELLRELLRRALLAFEKNDYREAGTLAAESTGPQGELAQRLRELNGCAQLPGLDVVQAVNLVLMLRSLERGLRYTQNIAEHVIYLTTGKDVRHKE